MSRLTFRTSIGLGMAIGNLVVILFLPVPILTLITTNVLMLLITFWVLSTFYFIGDKRE